jgi:ABC-type glycerol-3-phosphate transport system permease component
MSRAARAGRRVLTAVPIYVVLLATSALVLLPLYLAFVYSLHDLAEIVGIEGEGTPEPSLWENPFEWSNWESYKIAWTDINMPRYLLNSIIVSGVITIAQVITALLAAYAFAFLKFPFRTPLFFVFLATMMVPIEASVIPNYQTIQDLGFVIRDVPGIGDVPISGIDTYTGLTLPFLATGFGTFLLRQHFLTLPQELKDAADIDGYGNLRFLIFVVVPLSRAAIATLAVFAFIQAWNQYLWPLLVTNDDSMRTVQIGIATLRTTELARANAVLAATIIAFVPMLLMVIVFQRFLVRGLTAGAVKG